MSVNGSSGVPRKDFVRRRMARRQLALEANFEMWFCPRNLVADSEIQEFEWPNFFEWVGEKVDRRVCHMVLSERERERDSEGVRFVRI